MKKCSVFFASEHCYYAVNQRNRLFQMGYKQTFVVCSTSINYKFLEIIFSRSSLPNTILEVNIIFTDIERNLL